MNESLMRIIELLCTTSFGGAFGWILQRKQAQATAQTSEVENADKVLKYYREMVDDLGSRLTHAIKELSDTRIELSAARQELSDSRNIIQELKTTVENLTIELGRYKQLNGKK
jgi:septation ring formation regulator EzrA